MKKIKVSGVLHLARNNSRILNQIVDLITILMFWICAMTTTMVINNSKEIEISVSIGLLLPVFFWLYYLTLEYFFQKTLGKILTKTKVVDIYGSKPTFKQILIRTLCRSIPFEYISFLHGSPGIHDSLSSTRVIYD